MKNKYLSPLEVSKLSGKSRAWVYTLMQRKDCPLTVEDVAGRLLLVDDKKLRDWIELQKAIKK